MTTRKQCYFSETSNIKNNFLFTAAINFMVLVFILFLFKAVLIYKNWKYGFRLTVLPFLVFAFYLYQSWLIIRLTNISGNAKENSGPKCY